MTEKVNKKVASQRKLRKSFTTDVPDQYIPLLEGVEKHDATKQLKEAESISKRENHLKKLKRGQQVTFESDQFTLRYAIDELDSDNNNQQNKNIDSIKKDESYNKIFKSFDNKMSLKQQSQRTADFQVLKENLHASKPLLLENVSDFV